MTPVAIDVDGRIDLVDRDTRQLQHLADRVRARQSRLNDVMIVMERDQVELEAALRARITDDMLAPGVAALSLAIDQMTPTYHVSITAKTNGQAQIFPSPDQRQALETAIASEIYDTIERRAAQTAPRRWQPSVSATMRLAPDQSTTPTRDMWRNGSAWLRVLMMLLAIVIGAAAFLYVNASSS